MAFIVAAIVVLAILLLLNLLITFAILRRLRNHEERLGAGSAHTGERGALIGSRLPEFTATSTSGERVDSAEIVGPDRLVGFFSASCKACLEQATHFANHPDPGRVALVVMDSADDATQAAIVAALDGAPTVITDSVSGTVATALGVTGFPQLLVLDAGGTVVAARHSVPGLAASAR
jgi:peroxiredoxin